MSRDSDIELHLTERQARALTRAGEMTEDCLRSADLPIPDQLSLGLLRLASALERQEVPA